MSTVRRFNASCPDCGRWRCVCDDGCPDCGEWGEGACACIRRDDGSPDYGPALCLDPAQQAAPQNWRAPVRNGPPPPAIRKRLERLRAEFAQAAGRGRR